MDTSQLSFQFAPAKPVKEKKDEVDLGDRQLPLTFKKNPRAKHYLIYVCSDGRVSVTVPRRGTLDAARQFVDSKKSWIRRQLERQEAQVLPPREWGVGTEILLKGVLTRVELESEIPSKVRLGDLVIPVNGALQNIRPIIEEHLLRAAQKELPEKVWALAEKHGCVVSRVTVRNQSTRWGSCSPKGCISLNWRLIQAPDDVAEYVILHELMHLREMNHSPRFWNLVSEVCPDYQKAETWLKMNSARLGL